MFSWIWPIAGGSWFQDIVRAVHAIMREACTASLFPLFLLQTVVKIGMKIMLDTANGWRVLLWGSCVRSARNGARSVRKELCSTVTFFPAFKEMFPDLKTERGHPQAFDFRILWEMEHEACTESFASAVILFFLI